MAYGIPVFEIRKIVTTTVNSHSSVPAVPYTCAPASSSTTHCGLLRGARLLLIPDTGVVVLAPEVVRHGQDHISGHLPSQGLPMEDKRSEVGTNEYADDDITVVVHGEPRSRCIR